MDLIHVPPGACTVRSRRPALRLAAACALLAGGAVAAPASASVVSMAAGHSITVVHNIDMVVVATTDALDIGKTATVEVKRGGATVARAEGPLVDGGRDGGAVLEVNHGVEGAPAPGDCWESSTTPDIVQVDDRVIFTVGGTVQGEIVVDSLVLGAANGGRSDEVSIPLTITKHDGSEATGVDGEYRNPDSPEGRFRAAAGVRPGPTTNTYELYYTAPLYGQKPDGALSPAAARQELLTGDGHAAMFGHDDGAPEVQMVEGLVDSPGPADGCPALGGGGDPVDTVAPDAPTGLQATATSSTQIRLSWTVSRSTDVVGYWISRTGAPAERVGRAATTFTATGLTADTSYTFDVEAVDAAGNRSTPAATVTASTHAETPPPPPAAKPATPTGVDATSGTPGGRPTAIADWDGPAAGTAAVSSYRVRAQRFATATSTRVLSTSGVRTVASSVRSAELRLNNTRSWWRFQVRAVNGSGASAWSTRSNAVKSR